MRITWKGEDLGEYSGTPTIKESRFIKQQIGMLPLEFGEALDKADPEAIAVMIAILKARRGEDVDWEDIDGEQEDLQVEYNAEEKKRMKEAEAEAKKAEAAKAAGGDDSKGKGVTLSIVNGTSGAKRTASATSTKRSPRTPRGSGSSTDSPS